MDDFSIYLERKNATEIGWEIEYLYKKIQQCSFRNFVTHENIIFNL